ncbi:MAG TPA: hypothetical protein VFB54_10085 [Burkholderiales bacterium]|nr:hypothetical protein [Burkholderiales bacterium]
MSISAGEWYGKRIAYIVMALMALMSAVKLAHAIEPNSELAQQLLAERRQRVEGAIAQLSQRIEGGVAEGAVLAELFRDRGIARSYLVQYAEALEDFNRAIELDQVNPQYYEDRAITYMKLREFKAASTDLDMALGLDSKRSSSYREKGRLAFYQRDFERAAQEFQRALRSGQGEAIIYGAIWLEMALRRGKIEGDSPLMHVAAQVDPERWPSPVLQMFAGAAGPEAAIEAATKQADPRGSLLQSCEAYFYAGEKYLIDGQTDKAKAAFQAAVATGITDFMEYDWSVRELELMGK